MRYNLNNSQYRGRTIVTEGGQKRYVPFEDTKVIRLKVAPAMADAVDKALETVHWGAFISLEMRGKMVVSVMVEADPLAEMG